MIPQALNITIFSKLKRFSTRAVTVCMKLMDNLNQMDLKHITYKTVIIISFTVYFQL